MKTIPLFFLISLFVFTSSVEAKHSKKFEWDEVTEADWKIQEDTARDMTDAVMIFEKIIADDKKYQSDECYHVIYRRIRILSDDGREWGDVEVPFIEVDQKIEVILGRTILRDGTIIDLLPEHIFEKQTVKTKKKKIKGHSFSLPGVSNDCIIEYFIEYRMPNYTHQWLVQKEIALLYGELRWILAEFESSPYLSSTIEDYGTPNYLWLNSSSSKVSITELPNIKEPETLLCVIDFVPPFESEPYSIPSTSIKTRMLRYYGSRVAASTYWGNLSNTISKNITKFCKKNKRLKKVIEQMEWLKTDEEKIEAAFNWVRDSIKNTSYFDIYDPKKPEKKLKLKDRKSVNDILKRGYATSYQICVLFCDMLREMNIHAKVAFAQNRNEDLFVKKAKYWQFDERLVLIENDDGSIAYNTPGLPYTSLNQIPWFLEGVAALVAGSENYLINLPFSDAQDNTVNRLFEYEVDEDFEITGRVTESHTGTSAQYLRNTIIDEDSVEINNTLNEKLADEFSSGEIELSSYENLLEVDKTLKLKYTIEQPELSDDGGKILLQPLQYITKTSSPFDSKERKQAVMFAYASWTKETAIFKMDEAWTIEALPNDTTFINQAGECSVSFQKVGNVLNVQQLFVLYTPFMFVQHYPLVRDLFQARQDFSNMVVVYAETEE